MATNQSMFNDIHYTLTNGQAGVKEAGPVFVAVINAARDSNAVLNSISSGIAGVRPAGHILLQLGRIEANTVVIQNLVSALANVTAGAAFDEAKLLAGIDKTVRAASAEASNGYVHPSGG